MTNPTIQKGHSEEIFKTIREVKRLASTRFLQYRISYCSNCGAATSIAVGSWE